MGAPAELRFRTKSPEELRRSRAAHWAALRFGAATDAYHSSGALQAIMIASAYRKGHPDGSLVEMAQWLRGDETKMRNLIILGEIRHAQAGVHPIETWRSDLYPIIGDVFKLAQDILPVDEAILQPYLSLHQKALEDLRKPKEQQQKVEIQIRQALRRLAWFSARGRLSPQEQNRIWNVAAGTDLIAA